MLLSLTERLRQKYRTVPYPAKDPVLPERFRGRPHIDAAACLACAGKTCPACAAVCPTKAIRLTEQGPALDMGLCIFCGACAKACPAAALRFTRDWRLAATRREDLVILPQQGENAPPKVTPLEEPLRQVFSRSFRLRQISAAGCNACEADCNVLTTIVFDLARFGIDFVASPRHADAVLITGPLPRNMRLAAQKCYAAMPEPKFVIAVGACTLSGGLFRDFAPGGKGVSPHFSVDLFIPGCPPHPYTTLDGLLRLIGRL